MWVSWLDRLLLWSRQESLDQSNDHRDKEKSRGWFQGYLGGSIGRTILTLGSERGGTLEEVICSVRQPWKRTPLAGVGLWVCCGIWMSKKAVGCRAWRICLRYLNVWAYWCLECWTRKGKLAQIPELMHNFGYFHAGWLLGTGFWMEG
jgi:hypothetical protein